MKVKVGKWARRNDGTIGKINMLYSALCQGEECFEFHFTIETINNPRIKESITHTNTIKVANTPQELVQEGDLVGMNCEGGTRYMYVDELHKDHNKKLIYISTKDRVYTDLRIENIDIILTPNANGDYIKQWEE